MAPFWLWVALICSLGRLCAALGEQAVVSFSQQNGAMLLAGSSTAPNILVDGNDWPGVVRAANDLATDLGRVTGTNGTVTYASATNATSSGSSPVVIVGTIGNSSLISALVQSGKININQTQGQWEAFQTQLVSAPFPGVSQALVIAGADIRGSIYGLYDISQQSGVSPWYSWADVAPVPQTSVYVLNSTKIQGSPSIKYRGLFINDEQPALTDWLETRIGPGPYGSSFNHIFYESFFELLLRLRANYFWPASWGSMFNPDDFPANPATATYYGVFQGSSHTEPMMRATNEQGNPKFLNGIWSWQNNQANVTEFMLQGAQRAKPFLDLYTMGMRGLGDTASPTLNASQLEEIITVQRQLLSQVYNTTDVSTIPQMWCLYKEVGNYYAEGLTVPDDIVLLWADDNWGNMQRLPIGNETSRSGGAGIYYHADYVGNPRDYKWINTISLQKSWTELRQAYERGADSIWMYNVGDIKPLEIPIHYFMDMAYNAPSFASPDSTNQWLVQWATQQFGASVANATAQVVSTYGMYASRRKYELVDPTIYSIVDYDEANYVLGQWSDLVDSATSIYNQLTPAQQPAFFEMILHPSMAGYVVHQIHIGAAKNNLYAEQWRTSTNAVASQVLDSFAQDYNLTLTYEGLLDNKWVNMMSQTHLGYTYWQQPMRDVAPPLMYTQQQEISVAGAMGVTCDANNGSVPGDDNFHGLSTDVLTVPPMDPYGSSRWIDIYAKGPGLFNFNISAPPHVIVTPTSGTLGLPMNQTDLRLNLTIDWSSAPNGSTNALINITTDASSAPRGKYVNATNPYGNYNMPQIAVPINKTTVPSSFHGHVESDKTISIEAEHFTSNTSTSNSGSAYLSVIPGFGRTLSGVALLPFTAPSQSPNTTSSPLLTYNIYTFSPNISNANITTYLGMAMNSNPNRPLKYAIAVDNATPQVIQPVPNYVLGNLPPNWSTFVANSVLTNTTTHDLSKPGNHTLRLWLLEPNTIVQKIVVDLGGVRQSYLGPPESMIM